MNILKQWSEKLNGRECLQELTQEEEQELRDQGLVVIFGASDDLCEFRGSIYDEVGAYEGDEILLDKNGIFDKDECQCTHAQEAQKKCRVINAIFGVNDYAWQYETDIPHETFDILEDGERYCKGIIFDMQDLQKQKGAE